MKIEAPVSRDIVLVGGGHAHVEVLKRFGMKPEPGVRLNLISPDSLTPYSGMLPGYLAGHYALRDAHIDVSMLTRFAGARFYRAAATGIDLENRTVACVDHPPVAFDLLSIDIGSTPATVGLDGAENAVAIKPVDRFLGRWLKVERDILADGGDHRLVVVGAGAGGVEAALALNFRVRRALERAGKPASGFTVSVVAQSREPLETHNRAIRKRMLRALERNGIAFHGGQTVASIRPGELDSASGSAFEFDTAILVTPASAADWLQQTGLGLDGDGFIRVRDTLQSVTDDAVFAAGDTSAFEARRLPKSGVYAVRQGPLLADNLRRLATGGAPGPFRPQQRTLALISMGEKRAALSYGPLTAEGDWAWRFKDWIDRRWMRKYQDLPDMAAEAIDELGFDPMRCGGCGAKVPSDILKRVLQRVAPNSGDPSVLIGLDAPDDAAAFSPPKGKVLVQTVDQFRAFIEDPYLFGRITANHCLGDIFAMGAQPASALATITLPYSNDAKMEQDMEQLLSGALATFKASDVALIGGHTGEGSEMALGFTVNGFVDEGSILRKGGLQAGDAIILTKPLGTGVLMAADMRQAAEGPWIDVAIETMLQSNQAAAEIARKHRATAATDVTGFGLVGHLAEMAEPAGVTVALKVEAVPLMDGVQDLFERGLASSLQPANERTARDHVEAPSGVPTQPALFDPQTAGGLLLGVPAAAADACVGDLKAAGYARAAVIGHAEPRNETQKPITLE